MSLFIYAMPEEKNAPAGGAENIFGEMDVQFGDVGEANEVMRTTNWWKLGAAAATAVTAVSAVTFAVFGTDAYLKTAASDSFVFSTGLFSKGGVLCSLVNKNADADYGNPGNPCMPLQELDASVKDTAEKLRAQERELLAAYLDRKLNSNVIDSSLAKFILARGTNARIPYLSVLDAIAAKVAQTKSELVRMAKFGGAADVTCGSVSFVGTSVSFSCSVEADGVLTADPRVTAREGAMMLIKNVQSIDNLRIKTYPKSLPSGGTPDHSSSSVQFDLEYLLDANQL